MEKEQGHALKDLTDESPFRLFGAISYPYSLFPYRVSRGADYTIGNPVRKYAGAARSCMTSCFRMLSRLTEPMILFFSFGFGTSTRFLSAVLFLQRRLCAFSSCARFPCLVVALDTIGCSYWPPLRQLT